MNKFTAFWVLSLAAVIALVAWLVVADFKSTAVSRKIEIQSVAGALEASNTILSSLSDELMKTEFWFVGLFPEDNFSFEVLQEFLKNSPPEIRFDEIWLDEPWKDRLAEGPETSALIRSVFLRKNEELVRAELLKMREAGRRILIVSSPIDVNSTLEQSPAWTLDTGEGDLNFKSISFTGFPRLRGLESRMKMPCILPHADKEGTGAFGCQVLNISRRNYRKHFAPNARVILMEYVSDRDLLFMTDLEPGEVPPLPDKRKILENQSEPGM